MHAINWWNQKYLGAPSAEGEELHICKIHGDVTSKWVDVTQKNGEGWSHFDPLSKESRNMGQMGRTFGLNHGKSLKNGYKVWAKAREIAIGFPFSFAQWHAGYAIWVPTHLTGVEWVHCLFLFPLVLVGKCSCHMQNWVFFCV